MSISPSESVRVLHVDDESDLLEVTARFLEKEDPRLSVHTATDVENALSRIKEDEISCVVSDYDMPQRNGLEFLELVRDHFADLPFILYTGKGSEEIASKAISAGVDDYIQKEPTTDQYAVLANRIVSLVRSRRAENAVKRTEERYHNLVDTAPVPIMLFNEAGRAVYLNNSAVSFLNADSVAELKNKTFLELLHPDARSQSRKRFQKLMNENVSVPETEYRIQTVDGQTKKATVATAPGMYQGEPVAQAVVRYRPSEREDSSE